MVSFFFLFSFFEMFFKSFHFVIKTFVLIDFMPVSILVIISIVFSFKVDNFANLNYVIRLR
jgi:hypothetical protein